MGTAERIIKYYSPGALDECWLWQGAIQENGYGIIRHNAQSTPAHRVIYELTYGSIPDGLHIDHVCHNRSVCAGGSNCIHRRCVNPNHLEAVTPEINATRGAVARNRANPGCPNGHDPSEMTHGDRGWRMCLACARERSAIVRAEQKAGIRPEGQSGICANCTKEGKFMARGLCNACYLRQNRATKKLAKCL